MSLKQREALVDDIVEKQPSLRGFVRDLSTDLTAGSWDLVSYSFQRGFEAMWDLARADHTGLLQRPLLVLWRQSVELAIKSAVLEIAGRIDGRPDHNLQSLFEQLLQVRAAAGCCDNDVLARDVQAMVTLVQSFDPFADRFRYPAEKGGKPYKGFDVDLDELFQAHWIIVTWCEGGVVELKGDF
ncbi:hypothetical protein SAMN06295912_12629 [Sphingomonas laterariae]|uniref:HEPN domain-containing protein n=1 Tax=Edaphosphingomonas laterariae TaxID=861865 RepID=A0A239IQ55_9SPHN|nr:hypothetical protein [Sphingomonas laterariae]SNS95689.1 hypothetical protein SAMN06295912_12629 [Sphingomonas laterariae]